MGSGEDADGGLSSNEIGQIEDTHVEEPIYFDQTTRHIGSIQKNMVLDERDRSLLNGGAFGGGHGAAMRGFNPASTMPNYSVMMGGQNQ